MTIVYFYEVDLKNHRLALRAMEVFVSRTVKLYTDLYGDVVEITPISTVEGFNPRIYRII